MVKRVALFLVLLASFSYPRPKVLVYPFYGDNRTYARILWRAFCGEFFLKPYADVEPSVSERLALGRGAFSAAREVGADFIIEGWLELLRVRFLGFYSQIEARGYVMVLKVNFERPVFSVRKTVYVGDGGLPFSIPAASLAVTRAAVLLRSEKVEEALYKLGRSLADSIPDHLENFRFVEIGAFRKRYMAERLVRRARYKGYRAFVVREGAEYKVFVGPVSKGVKIKVAKTVQ